MPSLDQFVRDAVYALRGFRRQPGFTAAVVVSIALGIAANATVFSLVNGLLLGELPVREPARLVTFNEGRSMSYPDYADYRDGAAAAFEGVAGYFVFVPASIGGAGQPERIFGQIVSGNWFSVVGVKPALGRGIVPEEDKVPGRDAVVVLSDSLWRRRFGADPSVVGRAILVNGQRFTVVGVTPPAFRGIDRGLIPEFWAPLAMHRQLMPDLGVNSAGDLTAARNNQWLTAVGRLRPGVTRAQAAAAVNVIKNRLDDTYHKGDLQRKARPAVLTTAGGLHGELTRVAIGLMAVLMVVVGLVLLIACANVANLLLARAAARQTEIGIRMAIGAGRGALVRQLLTESLLLSLGGAAVGFLLAFAAARAISGFQLPLPLPIGFNFNPDLRVLAFTAALGVATGLVFGLAPALRATSPNLAASLKSGRAGLTRGRFAGRNLLVVVQVALSLVLLVGAGLFLRSLGTASSIDLGMKPDNILLMAVDPKLHGYSPERTRQFLDRLRDSVVAVPGVRSVSFLDSVPLSIGGTSFSFRPDEAKAEVDADVFMVGSRYFETLGIPLVRGRDFVHADAAGTAIINETMAARAFPGRDPLGRRLTAGKTAYTVVGVARNSKSRTLAETPVNIAYLFLEAAPEQVFSFYGISILVKTPGNPRVLERTVREKIAALDPALAVFNAETMREHVDKSLFVPRLCAMLLGIFGAVGLTLATIGLYGVMSYSVRRRTREIGIRMALGARSGAVLGMVIRQGAWLTGAGLAAGMALSWALSRFAQSYLYGVSATDGLTFAAVPVALAVVAMIAVALPARRASRIDPIEAVREE
jgi:predicted permease